MSGDVLKIRSLETQVKRLEELVKRLTARVDYLERERLRIKNDISYISSVIRK